MRDIKEYIAEALKMPIKDGGTLLERMKQKHPIGVGCAVSPIEKFLNIDKVNEDYDKNEKVYKKLKFVGINRGYTPESIKFACLIYDNIEYTPSDLKAMEKNIEKFVNQYAINPIHHVKIWEMENRWDDIKGEISLDIRFTAMREIRISFVPEEWEQKAFRTFRDEHDNIYIDKTKHKDGTDA